MTTPSLAQVRAFVAVADELHFGAAAAALGISQPALSSALASLESLRIGVIPTVAPYLLPALLRGLRRALPELQPEVREERTAALLAELGTGRLDVALIALPAEASGVSEIPLYDEDFVLLVPQGHRYSGGSNLSPAALQGQHLLLLDDGHCLRDQALELCRRAGVDPVASPAARTTSLTTVVQLVSSGLGTTLLPETALAAESRRGALAVARFCEPAPGRRIGLVYRASSARGTAYHELAHVIRRAASRLPIHPVAATG